MLNRNRKSYTIINNVVYNVIPFWRYTYAEWAVACAKTKYKDVYRIGGAGDKGRDVIAEYENGTFDYYQCKRYSAKLQPSQYWIEFGKLCYFVYNKDIPMPEKYYIIASHDLSKKMRTILENKEQ